MNLRILHIEDNPSDAELVQALLQEQWPACRIIRVQTGEELRAELRSRTFDVVISDFSMPHFDGVSALSVVHELQPAVPFIFVSGTIGEENAVEALKQGATDYIIKDRLGRLIPAIERALKDVRVEQQIREQSELLNQAHDAIIISDLQHRVIYWNQGAERLLGWGASEALGREVMQFVSTPDQLMLATAQTAASETGEWSGELRVRHKSGKGLIVDTHATLIRNERGEPKAHLTISSDITEKHQLREQFYRAQRLESIGMLAAGIAHDLNNVLAPILMAPPMLRLHTTNPADLKLLDVLEKCAERGSGLVRQILGFANGLGGERRPLQVKHLLRDLASFIEQTFPKSIRLQADVPTELWPVVGSATQVHQVLLNLCVNARDAMLHGGVLRLAARNIKLPPEQARRHHKSAGTPWLVIDVEDSGSGITPEVLERIWDPFFTTKADKGTGLGLSTVRGIVESHGGFIDLTTAVGRGTTFRVHLPAAETDSEANTREQVGDCPRGAGQLIFIVDDEAGVRDIIATALTKFGYRTLSAADPVESVAAVAARGNEIQLIIVDQHMPAMEAGMMASMFRRLNPGIPLLAISGHSEDERAFKAGRLPVDGFLQKPFTVEALCRGVNEILVQRAPQRAVRPYADALRPLAS